MRIDKGVSLSRRAMLGVAGLASAVLLATTVLGVQAVSGGATSNNPGLVIVTIPKGQTSATAAVPQEWALKAAICTLQSDPGNRSLSYVHAVDGTKGTKAITVFLDGPAPKAVRVACMLVWYQDVPSGPVSGPQQ